MPFQHCERASLTASSLPSYARLLLLHTPHPAPAEVLARYGSAEQKERWLKPLIAGKIRSSFAMTEFGIASSE